MRRVRTSAGDPRAASLRRARKPWGARPTVAHALRAAVMALLGASLPWATSAQQSEETDRAVVHRHALATVPFSEAIARRLAAPPGFRVEVWASGLGHPRMMEADDAGTVYVTRRDVGDVLALRDSDGDGRADQRRVLASGLSDVHGVALHGGWLYLASSTTIWRARRDGSAVRTLVTGLPDGGQHGNRMVRFGPDGLMYVSVGSSCNDCAEQNQLERATMMRYTPDGRHRDIIANGLRNTIGYDWHPRTGALWGMDHGSDYRGDRVPPEELNRIEPGRNFGWPICFGAQVVDPMTNAPPMRMALEPGQAQPMGTPMTREAYCARTEPAVLVTQPHAAPMALRFYTGTQFPPDYRGDAFVAMRGSWNRDDPAGYKVVRVRFRADGQPLGFSDFVTGFVDASAGVVYGRPTGIAFLPDGSMLVADDTNGAIYRVSHVGAR